MRIGNVIWDDRRNKVKFVNHRVISDLASSAQPLSYSPIIITPEWLERCGIEDKGVYELADLHVYGDSIIDIAKKGDEYYLYITFADDHNNTIYGNPFKYIHQLQNIYLDLIGEELTIKK